MAFNREKALSAANHAIERKQYKKALSHYKNICNDARSDGRARLFLGDLYLRTGDRANCLKSYAYAAHTFVAEGQLLKAVAVYRHMLQVDNGLHVIHVALARVYDEMGLVKDAVSQYKEALAVLAHRGQQLIRLQIIQELLDLDPENIRARVRLAEDFLAEGAIAEGVRELRAAAYLLDDAGRADDFLAVADRLLYHSPEDVNIARRVAALHMQRDAAQHALFRLQACHRAHPYDTEVLSMLGTCFLKLGQGHKALTVLRELARIHDRNGLITERNEALVRVLEIDPADQSARRVLQGRVANAPVEEELGFDELSFDAPEVSEESQGFSDDSSFSVSGSFVAPEASVSQVEFDDLDALAALVAGEPLSVSSLDDLVEPLGPEESESGVVEELGTSASGLGMSAVSELLVFNHDATDSHANSSRPLNAEQEVASEQVLLPLNDISVDEIGISSDVVDLPSSVREEMKSQMVASLEDLVAIVGLQSEGKPPLPFDTCLESVSVPPVTSDQHCESTPASNIASVVVEDIANVPKNNVVYDESDVSKGALAEEQKEKKPKDSIPNESVTNEYERAQEEGGVLPFRTELREWDFYIDNGFKDEAGDLLEELMQTYGSHPELLLRQMRLEDLGE